ncbi:hypothetical protein TNCV_1668021 [Trichonephila clavipes]|nr:hypothetical protein TNCV_1668021 [Trichonephila clavipes]
MTILWIGCNTTLDNSADVVGSSADVLKATVTITPPQPRTVKWGKVPRGDSDEDKRLSENDCEKYEERSYIIDNIPGNHDIQGVQP